MSYHLRPAQRTEAKPLIGLYAQSGAGKTYSALVLARGFAGPDGRIAMIETESGRGEAYADPGEYPEIGGYDVISMRDKFSPVEYGQAITAAEQAKVDALIIDSASHEWEGSDGVLGMAAANQSSGKKGPLVWQQPKMDHARHFVLRFTQTSIPLVILCMRAKYPMEEVTKNGKKVWQRADVMQPKQSEDILYEMFIHGWIDHSHAFHMTKCSSKALVPMFGEVKPLSAETGQQLAEWAQGATQAAGPSPYDLAMAQARLGKAAFLAFWNSPTGKAHREVLQPHMADFQAAVTEAETADVPDENPMGFEDDVAKTPKDTKAPKPEQQADPEPTREADQQAAEPKEEAAQPKKYALIDHDGVERPTDDPELFITNYKHLLTTAEGAGAQREFEANNAEALAQAMADKATGTAQTDLSGL